MNSFSAVFREFKVFIYLNKLTSILKVQGSYLFKQIDVNS